MRRNGWIGLLVLAAACDPAEGVVVQELPPLERSTPEARLGLPEVVGEWQFTGWEVAEDDTVSLAAAFPQLGDLALESQRLDSIAGAYVWSGGRVPIAGEVRRDGILSLVTLGGEGRIFAGNLERDTLWVHISTLVEPGSWPAGSRAGFVREEPAVSFVRLPGQPVQLAIVEDPAAADTLAGEELPPFAGPVGGVIGFGALSTEPPPLAAAPEPAAPADPATDPAPAAAPATAQDLPYFARPVGPVVGFGGVPGQPAVAARPEPAPAPRETGPRVLGVPTQPEPRPATPAPAQPAQPAPAEPVQPPPAPPPPGPRLLGVPVDTTSARR